MPISTLNFLALKALPSHEWYTIEPFVQNCLYPDHLRKAVSHMQRLLLHCARSRMASFIQLLEEQASGHLTLAPKNVIIFGTLEAYEVLKHGDHIVVMIGGWRHGYAHHGIVLKSDVLEVAHFFSPSGDKKMSDAKIDIVSYKKFFGMHSAFGVVPYCTPEKSSMDPATEVIHRDRAAKIARIIVDTPSATLHQYNLISWNCESFAWLCKTGGLKCNSDQVDRILNAIRNDLRKGEESFLLQAGVLASHSCVVS